MDICLSIRGPQKLFSTSNRDVSAAAKILKMSGEGARVMTLIASMLTLIKTSIDILLGGMSSRNSLVGTFPECTLRIRGMGNMWALNSF
eukprot:1740576-Amphidinium_carterae.1